MKKLSLFSFIIMGLLMASVTFAYQRGENRILDSGFETDQTGTEPEKWEIAKGG